MMMVLIAYLYLAGMLATSFIVIEVNRVRRLRATAFLLLWPISMPFVLIGAFFE